MLGSTERERNRDHRSSALWGTGGRGGEGRSSALWGKGGRGFVLTAVAVLALAAPMASTAGNGNGRTPPGQAAKYVAGDLLTKAKTNPNEKVRVIVQSTAGAEAALDAAKDTGQRNKLRKLDLIGGITAELNAKQIEKLAQIPGLSIVPDAPVKTDGLFSVPYTSNQLWPHENGNA